MVKYTKYCQWNCNFKDGSHYYIMKTNSTRHQEMHGAILLYFCNKKKLGNLTRQLAQQC